MLINTTKTKAMLITTPQKWIHLNNNNLQLTYNDEELSVVANDKILGVLIDDNLTWTNHIDALTKKMVSNVWLLSRIKEYLSTDQRVQFYKTYVQPHIDYCSTIWGGTSQRNLDRIYWLQQEAHRPQLAHLSETATADMQMACNLFPILSHIETYDKAMGLNSF